MTVTWAELEIIVKDRVNRQEIMYHQVISALPNTSHRAEMLAEEERYLNAFYDLEAGLQERVEHLKELQQRHPNDALQVTDALPSHLLSILNDIDHQKKANESLLTQPPTPWSTINPWSQKPMPVEQLTTSLKLMSQVTHDPMDNKIRESLEHVSATMPPSNLKRNLLILGVALGIVAIIAAAVFFPPIIIPALAASLHFFSLTALAIPGASMSVGTVVVSIATGIAQNMALKFAWNAYQKKEYDAVYDALKLKIINMRASPEKGTEEYHALMNEAESVLAAVDEAKKTNFAEKINGKPINLGTLIKTLNIISESLDSNTVDKLHHFEEEVHKSSFLNAWNQAAAGAKVLAVFGAIGLVVSSVISPSTWFAFAAASLPTIGSLLQFAIGVKLGDIAAKTVDAAGEAPEKIMTQLSGAAKPAAAGPTKLVDAVSSFKQRYESVLNHLPSKEQLANATNKAANQPAAAPPMDHDMLRHSF